MIAIIVGALESEADVVWPTGSMVVVNTQVGSGRASERGYSEHIKKRIKRKASKASI